LFFKSLVVLMKTIH